MTTLENERGSTLMFRYEQTGKNGITYVFEVESRWIPELKQPRSFKRCIGRINPETGELEPTGKRGRKPKNADNSHETVADIGKLRNELESKQKRIDALEESVKNLQTEVDKRRQADALREKRLAAIIESLQSL